MSHEEVLAASGRTLLSRGTQRNLFEIKPKSDCIYHAVIDLDSNGRPFGSKSIGAWSIQSDFGLI